MRLARAAGRASLGGKVFFCNSGAEANEAAIKLARKAQAAAATIVVVHGAFHGRTYGALSAHAAGVQAGAVRAARARASSSVPRDDPAALDAAVDEGTAAVLLEPIQGETGVHAALRRAAARGARGAATASARR